MIKRIRLLTKRAELGHAEFCERWLHAFAEGTRSQAPSRAVACLVLHNIAGSEAPHDAISMEWFSDIETLALHPAAAELVDPRASVCIIADELVLRGADWLQQRWAEPSVKYKHMALARRAPGLSAAEFSERWRNRPGRIGGGSATPVVNIPEDARGHAYVQNHPRATSMPEPVYDAINEVYFDDLTSMRGRIQFFAEQDVRKADAELVSETRFAIVSEHVIQR